MPWISVIDEGEATGKLKEIYEELKEKRGKVGNILKVHSLNPQAMKDHADLYVTLMFGKSRLKREERELIAVAVSITNRCEYCINHHAEALNNYWKDNERVKKLIQDYKTLNLPERIIKMFEYAIKLTKTPHTLDQKDINNLRESGFSDEEILNINLITSYFNFVNRIALGLGVESTLEEIGGYKY